MRGRERRREREEEAMEAMPAASQTKPMPEKVYPEPDEMTRLKMNGKDSSAETEVTGMTLARKERN